MIPIEETAENLRRILQEPDKNKEETYDDSVYTMGLAHDRS